MKHILFILFFLFSHALLGQQTLFSTGIAEVSLKDNQRLSPDLKSHYISTRYAIQADFISEDDFIIFINDRTVINCIFEKMYFYPSGSFSYTGISDDGQAEISFSKYNNRTAGFVTFNDGRKYIIDQVDDNVFAISLLQESIFKQRDSLPDFIEDSPGELSEKPDLAGICDLGNTCSSASVIDLMVVYTPLAETNWGGTANTVANITQAVTNMNTALTNSGVTNVTFRLVHTALVTYTESGSFSTDLSRLGNSSDGFIDNVHTLRNQYGADMVSLIVGTPTSSCGIGYLNTSPTSYSSGNGFNVSLYSCVVGNFTMSHEFGHNMGLRHDWFVDASTTPCSHHHGYTNQTAITLGTASAASARWRTIMAYNDHCVSVGISCTRVNRWSNPVVNYNGEPTGRAIGVAQPCDEAYAFYRMACLVANFRPTMDSSVLSLKVFIDGFYRGSGIMTGIINASVTDTITVSLASTSPPYAILYSYKSIINTSGNGTFKFPNPVIGSSFYLVVRHRSSLETWSAAPVNFSGTSVSYDFTLSQSSAYGSKLVNFGDGRYGLFGGDVNQDDNINMLDNEIVESAFITFLKGYVVEDLTGDSMTETADYSLVQNRLPMGLMTGKP